MTGGAAVTPTAKPKTEGPREDRQAARPLTDHRVEEGRRHRPPTPQRGSRRRWWSTPATTAQKDFLLRSGPLLDDRRQRAVTAPTRSPIDEAERRLHDRRSDHPQRRCRRRHAHRGYRSAHPRRRPRRRHHRRVRCGRPHPRRRRPRHDRPQPRRRHGPRRGRATTRSSGTRATAATWSRARPGADTLVFNGANANEKIDLSRQRRAAPLHPRRRPTS